MGILETLLKIGKAVIANDARTTAKGPTWNDRVITLEGLPKNLEELKAMRGADLRDEYYSAALAVAALCNYKLDKEATYEMLNFLKGPEPLNVANKQFLRDCLGGKEYIPYSFLMGTSPQNNYLPIEPYRVIVSSNPYSYTDENRATLYLTSSGADSRRPITLRRKPSTGQWFLTSFSWLGSIRIPVTEDKWS